jgi:hypothetical protein
MKKRTVVLTLILVSLLWVTCTGCAGMVLKSDGTMVAYAVGQSKVQLAKTPQKMACTYGTDPAPVSLYAPAPGRQLIYSSHRQLIYSSKAPKKTCAQEGPGLTVNVEGGNLGAGWFGAITTFLMLYFAPIGAVL